MLKREALEIIFPRENLAVISKILGYIQFKTFPFQDDTCAYKYALKNTIQTTPYNKGIIKALNLIILLYE